MIIGVLILCFITIIVVFSSNNYIFAQNNGSGEQSVPPTLKELIEQEKLRIDKIKQKNEVAQYNWKTCSEPKLGFSIEYPSHWIDEKEYDQVYAELRKQHDEKQGEELPTQIYSNDTNPYYSCIDFYNFPKKYGNSTEETKVKIMEEIKDDRFFPWDLPYQISFRFHADWNFKENIEEEIKNKTDDRFFPFDLTNYDSVKILTRIFALSIDRSPSYFLIEKPNFNKYNIDGMKTGSFSYASTETGTIYPGPGTFWYTERSLCEHVCEYIFIIRDDILYTFKFDSKKNLDISKEEYSAVKKHMINSIRWLN